MGVSWSTDFPGGNGLLLETGESSARAILRFAAEPKNCPQALWFHVRASGLAGRGATFVLANPEQTLGGADWSNDRPVWRADEGAWERADLPRRVEARGGRFEWAWDVAPGADAIELAFCYPYQPADLEATLRELAGAFDSAMIGVTLAGRTIPRVFNRVPRPDVPGVFLTARHHAGETPGSWVLDGLLRHVAASGELRERITWWLVPFVDLDDVLAGSYGKDPFPHDCNRGYGPPGPRRPEAGAVMADARRLKAGSSALFFADIHAPGHAEQTCYVPLRGWEPESPPNPVAEPFALRFQAAQPEDIRSPLAHVLPKASAFIYPGMSSRGWAQVVLGAEGVSVEISYQGNGKKPYTIADYHRLGAALAETIAEWLA